MIIQFQNYLTVENMYLWTTFGVLPFWFLLIVAPNSKFTQIFTNSILLPLILACAYVYMLVQYILLGESILDIFKIYLNLDNLYTIFASENMLVVFWLHFLAINIFIGSWISRDGVKYNIPRKLVSVPLVVVYLTGPLGFVLYWLIRIFYAKRLSIND